VETGFISISLSLIFCFTYDAYRQSRLSDNISSVYGIVRKWIPRDAGKVARWLVENNNTTEQTLRWLVGVAGARPSHGVSSMLPSAHRLIVHPRLTLVYLIDLWLFVRSSCSMNCAYDERCRQKYNTSRLLQTVTFFIFMYFASFDGFFLRIWPWYHGCCYYCRPTIRAYTLYIGPAWVLRCCRLYLQAVSCLFGLCTAVLLSLALVLGLEVSSRTNFESLALALALMVKSLALADRSLALRVALGHVRPLDLTQVNC